MAAALTFLLLVIAPTIWGAMSGAIWVFFFVMFVGLPLTFTAMPQEKPTQWDRDIWVANDPEQTQRNLDAALIEWKAGRRWSRAVPLR